MSHPTGRVALGALAGIVALATAAHAKVSDADKKILAEMALHWAVAGGIPDFKLVKDPSNLVVDCQHLPDKVELELPDRTIRVLSGIRIQAEADFRGDFLYFQFGAFKGDAEHAQVPISLIWAVGANSKTQYLSGGGSTLTFEKRDGKWQLLPVMNRWMS